MPLSDWTNEALGAPVLSPKPRTGSAPHSDSWAMDALTESASPEATSPSLLDRIGSGLETVTAPLGILKRGVDAASRAASSYAIGAPVAETETTGSLARAGLGLDPGQGEEAASTAGRLAGRAVEFGTDLATDPLSYLIPGGGKTARVAAAAFAPGMLVGAAREGAHAFENFSQNGFTPEVAEQALGSALSGGFGLLSARHALTPTGVVGATPEHPLLRQMADEARPVEPAAPVPVDAPAPGLRRPSFLDEGLDLAPSPGPELGYGRGGVPIGEIPPTPRDAQVARDLINAPDDPLFAAAKQQQLQSRQAELDALAQQGLPSQRAQADQVQQEALQMAREQVARESMDTVAQARQEGIQEGARILGDVVQNEMQRRVQSPVGAPRPQELILPEPTERVDMQRLRDIANPPPPDVVEQAVTDAPVSEITPQPREGDRRQQSIPVPEDRRLVDRRAQLAQEVGLDPEHPAVRRLIEESDKRTAAEEMASTDELTGVGSGPAYRRELAEMAARGEKPAHVSEIDVQGIGATNNHPELGERYADAMLAATGRALKEAVGDAGKVYRKGGDEFVVNWKDAASAKEGHARAKQALENVEVHISDESGKVLDQWLGVDHYEADGPTFEEASKNLYARKREFKAGRQQLLGDSYNPKADLPSRASSLLREKGNQGEAGLQVPGGAGIRGSEGVTGEVGVEPLAPEAPVVPSLAHGQAVDATLQQMEQRLRHRDVTEGRRVPIRGEGQGGSYTGRVEGYIGAPSVKEQLGLDHLTESPDRIAKAIQQDGNNPIYREARAAAERADPFGFVEEADGLKDSVETPGGDASFDPASFDKPTPATMAPEPSAVTPNVRGNAPLGVPRPRLFDRDAAYERMRQRGKKANDLGSATAEGVGALRDAAEIGASYIEDYARNKSGSVPDFASWARVVGQKLANVIPNVSNFLRQIYDEAVSLFRGRSSARETAPEVATEVAPAAPASPPAPPGKPPADTTSAAPMGRPVEPGESPRVEAKVENVREVAPETPLSRDTVRTHESLDPRIRKRVDDVTADPKEEAAFFKRASEGKLDDVDMQAMDSLVAGKREAYESARQELIKAQTEGGDTGPQNVAYLKAAFDQVALDYAKAARSDVEAGTKIARALSARARVMEAAGKSTPDQFLRKVFRQIPDVSDAQATEMLRVLKEEPHKLGDLLHASLKPGFLDKTLEAWKAGLVSAPGTQIANILGNVGEQVMRVGETATAAAVDKLMGGQKTRLGGEAKYELRGAYDGARKSLGQLGTEMRDIFTLAPEKIDLAQSFEHQVGKVGGKSGRAIRIPFRLLGAFDRFFQGMGGEAELYKRAFRRAGGDVAKADGIIRNPPADLMAEVSKAKIERVFQDPNKAAQMLTMLRGQNKLLHVVLPFIQTPANIARMAIQRSPAGFVEGFRALSKYNEALKSGADAAEVARLKGEAVDKLARPLLGTGIMLTFGALAKAGGMTGSGPADAKERNVLRDQGWQPYSFVVKGPDGKNIYIPFNRFEPISSLMGFAADMVEAGDSKSGNELFAKGVGSVVQNLTSKSYLQGIADAAELINDPMGAGAKYVTNLGGTIIPNVVAKTAQAIDPTVRDTRAETTGLAGVPQAILRTVESRIPGLSSTLPARRGGTGEPIERRGNALTRFAFPVQPSKEEEGLPFAQALIDLDAVPSAPRKEIKMRGRPVRLTDEEYSALQDADEKTTQKLRKVAESPAFKRLNDEQKRGVIRNAYERGRSDARNRVLRSASFRQRASAVLKARSNA